MQYLNGVDGGRPCDVDPISGEPTNAPCVGPDGVDVPDVGGADAHAHHDFANCRLPCQAVVTSNIADWPEPRAVEFWVIAKDVVGGIQDIASVTATVHAPGASGKPAEIVLSPRTCSDLGIATDVATPHHAALNSGGLGVRSPDLADCEEQLWRPYSGTYALGETSPPGAYQVCITATDMAGNTTNPRVCHLIIVMEATAGDADCSGAIDSVDAALVLQYEAALIDPLLCAAYADVNRDGLVNSIDAVLILQHGTCLIEPWLCG
jgi:hypothetical protein